DRVEMRGEDVWGMVRAGEPSGDRRVVSNVRVHVDDLRGLLPERPAEATEERVVELARERPDRQPADPDAVQGAGPRHLGPEPLHRVLPIQVAGERGHAVAPG